MISGFPDYMSEEIVLQFLRKYGELKSFYYMKEKLDSKGQVLCEYSNMDDTFKCVNSLHGTMLGNN